MKERTPQEVILIGCGAVSQQFYLPALRSLERSGVLCVKAIADPNPQALSKIARAFPRAQAANSPDEVSLRSGSLAIIASPPKFHAAQAIAAVGKGWHVLCEKPVSTTVAEAEEMVAAAKSHGRLLAVGLYKRFFPASRYLHDLCHRQQLGRLVRFTVTEGGAFRWPAASASFFDKSQSFGGVLADVGVHLFDLLGWWLGPPEKVSYADDAMGGIESNAWVELSYPGGASGTVHLSRDWQTDQSYRFLFESGVVHWKVNDANGLTLQLGGTGSALKAVLVPELSSAEADYSEIPKASNAQSFIEQLRNVVAAIEGREDLVVPGSEALDSLRLILNCYASKAFLEQPWLPSNEAQRARTLA
jgi:predicted dehydrogenase